MSDSRLETVMPKITSNGNSTHTEQVVATATILTSDSFSVVSPVFNGDFGMTKSKPKFIDETKENIKIIAVAKDLKDSEAKYRRLFEAAQDGILILDAKTGLITDVNPCLLQLMESSREEFLGKALWDIGLFSDIETYKVTLQELKAAQYIHYDDLSIETKDGRSLYVEFVSNVYLVNRKKYIQCNIRDITRRKHAEAALAAQEPWTRFLRGSSTVWGWFVRFWAKPTN